MAYINYFAKSNTGGRLISVDIQSYISDNFGFDDYLSIVAPTRILLDHLSPKHILVTDRTI